MKCLGLDGPAENSCGLAQVSQVYTLLENVSQVVESLPPIPNIDVNDSAQETAQEVDEAESTDPSASTSHADPQMKELIEISNSIYNRSQKRRDELIINQLGQIKEATLRQVRSKLGLKIN